MSVTLDQLKKLALDQYGFTVPNFAVNLIKGAGNAQVLAKPELRISEGEKAQLTIGDRIPIPTTTFNTQTALGGTGAIVPITSFQYQDVGIKIEMEPRVHHNKEITLKLTVEVSNLGTPVTFGGQTQPTISTRTISSTIRLKDGETNFLAGLIRTDKTNNSQDVPFLSDIPIVGRLLLGQEGQRDEHGPGDDDLAAHHPGAGHQRGRPAAGVRRHREQHFLPGRPPRRVVQRNPRTLRQPATAAAVGAEGAAGPAREAGPADKPRSHSRSLGRSE